MRQCGLRHEHVAIDIGFKRAADVVLAHILELFDHHLVGRVVHQNVELAKGVDGGFDGSPALVTGTHVSPDGLALTAFGADDAFCLVCIAVVFVVDDGHLGAFHGKGNGHRPTNARVTPGDQGNLALELAGG